MKDTRFSSPSAVFSNKGKPSGDVTMVGYKKNIPEWKTVDFWMGGVSNGGMGTAYDGRVNWRAFDRGGIKFSENAVNENVLLIPSGKDFKIAGGISYEDGQETLSGGAGGIMDALKDASEIITGATWMPAWKAKTFNGLDPLKVDGTYEFEFKFGNAGLYNAFEEVVKPIMALTMFFGVEVNNKGDFTNGISSSSVGLKSPYPTKAQFLAAQIKGALGELKGFKFDDLTGGSLSDAINSANSTLQSAISAGARDVSTSALYRNVWMKWGRFVVGPLVYNKTSYSFNMDELDSYGWPISGKFTIEGLESMRASSTQAMLSPFIKGV